MKPILSFYTNMPTPYQLDFFAALKEYFDLRVIYFSAREADRQWQLPSTGEGYSVKVLKNNRLALFVQKRFPSFHFSNEIRSVIKEDHSGMVIVNGTYWSPNVLLALYLSRKKKKLVSFWAEPVFPSRGIRFSFKKLLLWPVRRYTDLLLAIGKKAEEGYRAYGYNKSIYNIPYNIDIDLFKEENLDQTRFQELVRKYKSNGETVLLSSGSLIERKGMDTVISAFRKSNPNFNLRLLIIGEGSERDRLKEMINNDDRIELVGFQEKEMIPYWFRLADIFIFASRYDGWGLVINEAMSAGNAIICSTNVGAAYNSLEQNENAILCDPGSVEQYTNAINLLAENKSLMTKLALNARSSIQMISSQRIAEKIYAIFRMGK
jgi:glycosyltransferase involved in cell wall biosynthesis